MGVGAKGVARARSRANRGGGVIPAQIRQGRFARGPTFACAPCMRTRAGGLPRRFWGGTQPTARVSPLCARGNGSAKGREAPTGGAAYKAGVGGRASYRATPQRARNGARTETGGGVLWTQSRRGDNERGAYLWDVATRGRRMCIRAPFARKGGRGPRAETMGGGGGERVLFVGELLPRIGSDTPDALFTRYLHLFLFRNTYPVEKKFKQSGV
ncbi:hypothetical protein EDB85DRAFT_1897225 [Lactarius pseudohatsudake]|nr:hypothetical protein EDB85DRAFT_1897225 [Lactarius pseudohatsudake]